MPESPSDARQVTALLLRWDELRGQGRELTAEELCRDRPGLLPEVRRRIEALRAMYQAMGENGQPPTVAPPPFPSLAETLSPPPPAPSQREPETLPPVPLVPASPETALHVAGYEVLGELGRGGMGVVYRARDPRLRRLVALKMVLAGGYAGEDLLTRFRTEAEAVARLQHPNIVQIYEIGEHDGLPYFVLEFCPGGSLDRKLSGTPLPPQEAARLVETLAGRCTRLTKPGSSTAT